jgi:hypothetical protein
MRQLITPGDVQQESDGVWLIEAGARVRVRVTVPAGNLSKASFVGANTVKGPLLFKVSTSPAALTAATRVVWSAELTALSTMSRERSMGAPPTIGFSESILFIICAEALLFTIAIDATANSSIRLTFFTGLLPSFF